jgi:hypothetical protein
MLHHYYAQSLMLTIQQMASLRDVLSAFAWLKIVPLGHTQLSYAAVVMLVSWQVGCRAVQQCTRAAQGSLRALLYLACY